MPSIMPMLIGRATSKPRTCLIDLILISTPRRSLLVSFSLLHLVPKDAFNNLRKRAAPAAQQRIVDRKRILDGCEFLVFLIQRFVGDRAEMEFHERALCFLAPQILHEGIDDRAIHRRNISIYDN